MGFVLLPVAIQKYIDGDCSFQYHKQEYKDHVTRQSGAVCSFSGDAARAGQQAHDDSQAEKSVDKPA